MKFDHARNSAELRELFDYLFCVAIGCTMAALLGMSWMVASLIVLYAFKRWKKGGSPSRSIRILALVTCIGLLLGENWSAFREGVSAGVNAAATDHGSGLAKPKKADLVKNITL